MTVEFPPRHRRKVAVWLFAVCAMIFGMIVLGGATRLTGSGLSIMEWAPIMGALPPVSEAEWQRLFALYQQIPQYELLNKGMALDGFKHIFLLEYLHRLWGRLIGLAFLLPLIWFVAVGAIPRRSRAIFSARAPRSEEPVPGSTQRRVRMPVRVRIHSSLVSTMLARSVLVTMRSG